MKTHHIPTERQADGGRYPTSTGYTLVSGTLMTSPDFSLYFVGDNAKVIITAGYTFSGPSGVGFRDYYSYLQNNGHIVGKTNVGVMLDNGGTVVNGTKNESTAATIRGVSAGVDVAGAAGTVTNYGVIGSTHGVGVLLQTGGTVTNNAGGAISGTAWGVEVLGSGVVTNYGSIRGVYSSQGGAPGGGGIYLASGTLSNSGTIAAGRGGYGKQDSDGGSGGSGVFLAGVGTIKNTGTITGGLGGRNDYGTRYQGGGNGGVGVSLNAGGTLSNTGLIAGGVGGYGYQDGGGGGTGLAINGGVATNTTSGTISGGSGGYGYYGGKGGVGVDLQAGTMTNFGMVVGGDGGQGYKLGGGGGTGAEISGGTLVNNGTVSGCYNAPNGAGLGGGIGVYLEIGTLTNNAVISGGNRGAHATGTGGTGLYEVGGAAVNSSGGTISGGSSEYGAGTGGAGVMLAGGTLTNNGNIVGGGGGYPGGSGGAGVVLSGGALMNDGTVMGGKGAVVMGGTGGAGGAGLVVTGGAAYNLSGGAISGGFGGVGGSNGGAGGAGVYLDGGTLVTSGVINGGIGGPGQTTGATGDAVQFGALASTLIIDPGAQFNGDVVANSSVNDVLDLAAGTNAATLTGLGTLFAGFTTLTEDPGATWTLAGANASIANITVSGALYLAGGALTATTTTVGTLGVLSGIGTINGAVADSGLIDANGGTVGGTLSIMGLAGINGGTWSGGGLEADFKSTLQLADNTSITTDAGAITLSGAGSGIHSLDTGTNTEVGLDLTLQTIATGGMLALLDGQVFKSNHGTGTLACLGTLVVSDGAILHAANLALGGSALVSGNGTITAGVTVSGDASVAGQTIEISGPVIGTGLLTIDSGATLLADGTLSVASVAFAPGGDTLALVTPAEVTSTLSNFFTNDIIDLKNIIANHVTYSGNTLTVTQNKTIIAQLTFQGDYTTADFKTQRDGHNGTDIIYVGPPAPPDITSPEWTPHDLPPVPLGDGGRAYDLVVGGWNHMGYDTPSMSPGLPWELMHLGSL